MSRFFLLGVYAPVVDFGKDLRVVVNYSKKISKSQVFFGQMAFWIFLCYSWDMKILVVAPTPFFADRGTHIRILEEALALEKRGHKITIATYHIGRDIEMEVKSGLDVRRINRLLFWYKKLEAGPDWQKLILDLMLLRKVFYLARTQRPDVIHAHLHEGVLIGWIVKTCLFWRKINLVADFHGSLTREMESHDYLRGGILKKIFRKIEKIINGLGDGIVASSWENAQDIRNNSKGKSVSVILDGVNLDGYRKISDAKDELKREFELPQNKKIFIYSGAMVLNKGINYLLEAIAEICAQRDDVFFVLAGFPPEGVLEFVATKKLEKTMRVISPLNYFDLPKLLSACDVGIDPKDSSTKQASGKILQYMGAGLPVVCFDRENNRNYLKSGAFYANEVSADALAAAIREAADSSEQIIKEKGDANKEGAREFSWDSEAQKLEKMYSCF